MRELERVILLKNVDDNWMDHIDAMDELKQGISLRSYGQQDPVVAYRLEGFDMFEQMILAIREDTVKMLLTVVIKTQEQPKREQNEADMISNSNSSSSGPAKSKKQAKPSKNSRCPCKSGKKYKNCCGKTDKIIN